MRSYNDSLGVEGQLDFFLILDLVYVNDVMHKLCNDNLLCEHHN
jgi:hypothetical protein